MISGSCLVFLPSSLHSHYHIFSFGLVEVAPKSEVHQSENQGEK
ncbi:Uncharacterised protein [Chlamydia abortus]|nr:Uncharacterised protein [Chlamydia abortus]